jgi:hypothetical protein
MAQHLFVPSLSPCRFKAICKVHIGSFQCYERVGGHDAVKIREKLIISYIITVLLYTCTKMVRGSGLEAYISIRVW